MIFSKLPLLSLAAASLTAATSSVGKPDKDGKYEISSSGLRLKFIPYGASISNLFINSTHGVELDVVLGFDNASYYSIDRQHPHLGGVPGRYANRIKNSSFVIDGETYHVLPNENPTVANPQGIDTLHGGPDGWDWRNWTVVAHTDSSITFSLVDPDGDQGFPGEVISYVTYSVDGMNWDFTMMAFPVTKKTPIMLSSHTYWNLDGFMNPSTNTIFNHTLSLPFSGQRVGVDSILIPDGTILPNEKYSVNDFWSAPKALGANFSSPDLLGNCGAGCRGYDNCYTVNRQEPIVTSIDETWLGTGPIATLASPWSGVSVDIFSDQDAFQVYSCQGQNGTLTLKNTQGYKGGPRTVQKYGCLVMEVEDWIDGINNEEWGKKQVYEPGEVYELKARYTFSVAGK